MALRIDIVTAFPELVEHALTFSMFGRSRKRNLVELHVHQLRDYAVDKHRTIDDTPYGGGGGMVLKAEPMFLAVEHLLGLPPIGSDDHVRRHLDPDTEVVLLSPQGELFVQKTAVQLSLKSRLVLLCGHYKGIDERVREKLATLTLSIGDYVCSGGEYPALVVADAVARLIPGTLNDAESALTDSFTDEGLDCAAYTKPVDFRGMRVPQELLSGNHVEIRKWREAMKREHTRKYRPDLVTGNKD